MRKILTLMAALLATSALAQFEFSPQGIIVNPTPSFQVDIWLDKSGSAPVYQPGERITISVRPSADAWIYLFNVRSDGQVVQILPNTLDQDGRNNYVRAGQTRTFPQQNAGYHFEVTTPFGLDKVIVVASREQLNTSTLASFRSGEDFATSNIGESGFAQALGIIVTPVPSQNWVTATAHFWVGSPPVQQPVPQTGTVSFRSSPNGAHVYIGGQYYGTTPLNNLTFNTGSYQARFQLDGYEDSIVNFNVSGGSRQTVEGSLRSLTGSLRIIANVGGAQVFINGALQGTIPSGSGTLDLSGLATGTHELVVIAPGYNTHLSTVRINSGSRTEVRVSQSRR